MTVTARPNAGYEFVRWSGVTASTEKPHDGCDERQPQPRGLLHLHSTNAYTYANSRTNSDSNQHAYADRYVGACHLCGFRPNRWGFSPRSL